MHAVFGTVFVVLAVLGYSVMLLASRKPNPAAWTTYTVTHEFAAIGVVSLLGFGIAFLFQAIELIGQQPPTTTHLVVIASTLVVFTVAWKRLRVRATLAEYARQTESATHRSEPVSRPVLVPDIAGTSPGLATSVPENPSSPTPPRTPRLRKKAA